jgi:hypothetical protein
MMEVTPLAIELHRRSQRFHAEIARRASMVPQREERTYTIPNTPFGIPKQNRPSVRVYVVNPENHYGCMWFYDLVNFVPTTPEKLNTDRILRAVARFYGVSRQDILSIRRTDKIVRPRQVTAYLVKTMTERTLPDIGRRLGGRDHTTILYAVRKIEALIQTDAKLAAEIDEIKRMVAA